MFLCVFDIVFFIFLLLFCLFLLVYFFVFCFLFLLCLIFEILCFCFHNSIAPFRIIICTWNLFSICYIIQLWCLFWWVFFSSLIVLEQTKLLSKTYLWTFFFFSFHRQVGMVLSKLSSRILLNFEINFNRIKTPNMNIEIDWRSFQFGNQFNHFFLPINSIISYRHFVCVSIWFMLLFLPFDGQLPSLSSRVVNLSFFFVVVVESNGTKYKSLECLQFAVRASFCRYTHTHKQLTSY